MPSTHWRNSPFILAGWQSLAEKPETMVVGWEQCTLLRAWEPAFQTRALSVYARGGLLPRGTQGESETVPRVGEPEPHSGADGLDMWDTAPLEVPPARRKPKGRPPKEQLPAQPKKRGRPPGSKNKSKVPQRKRKAAAAVKTRDQTSSKEEGSSPSEDESEGVSEEGESEGVESGEGLGDSEGEDGHSENSDDVLLPGWRK